MIQTSTPPRPALAVARWVSELRIEDVPATTRSALRTALLDTLAAGLYGTVLPWTQAIRTWSGSAAPRRRAASAWGERGAAVRTADAALVNGVSAHGLELDDYHNSKTHPGAVVIPAALAIAEAHDLDGKALLTAIAAGYETMIRTSLAMGPIAARLRGWHLTGICGTFGAAAAAASLLKLDTERTAWALGIAGTQSAGTWAFNADGAMTKRLHPGRSSQSGVFAAEIAELGFTGPTAIYEYEDGGVLEAFAGSKNTAPLLEQLGSRWHSENISFKPYSCCGSTHSSIDAARELRNRFGEGVASGAIRVGVSHALRVQCGFDYVPSTELNAQMSLRYCVAAALLEGAVLPAQFTTAKLSDPVIRELADRIELIDDPELDRAYPAKFSGWVEATLGGKHDRVFVDEPLGSPAHPLDRASIGEKARTLLADRYDAKRLAEIERAVDDIEKGTARGLISAIAEN